MLARLLELLYLFNAATPVLKGIIELHHDIFFGLILFLILIFRVWYLDYRENPSPRRIGHGTFQTFLFFLILLTSPVMAGASGSEEGALPIIPSGTSSSGFENLYVGAGQEGTSSSAPQGVPQDPNGVQPLPLAIANPLIPVLQQPVLRDEVRREQLYNRLILQSFGQPALDISGLLPRQMEIEKKVEAALILDGIRPLHYENELPGLRGVIFSPQGVPLSSQTLSHYLREIAEKGTRQSTPYRKVYRAIRSFELFRFLDFR